MDEKQVTDAVNRGELVTTGDYPLAAQDDDELGRYFKPTRLMLPENVPFDRWLNLGQTLRGMEKGINWWIGDWLNYGERWYGEMYTQALEDTDYKYQSLANMKYVASKFPPHLRRSNLSFSIHAELAPLMQLSPETVQEIMDVAEERGMSVRDVHYDVQLARKDLERMAEAVLSNIQDQENLPASVQMGVDDHTGNLYDTLEPHVEWLDDLLEITLVLGNTRNTPDLRAVRVKARAWMREHGIVLDRPDVEEEPEEEEL